MDWYAAYTKPQAEARAAEGVARHGFEAYLPMLKQRVRHRGKKIMVERPLFPRYIFIGFVAAPPWLEVIGIEGIVTIIGNSGKPLRIDNAIIAELRERIAAGEFERRPAPAVRPGMKVRIANGPMRDIEGVCAAVTGDTRADLFVKLLGQTVRVKIGLDQLVEVA